MPAKKRRTRNTPVAVTTPPPPVQERPAAPPGDRVLIAILAAAFLARLFVLLALHDHPLLQPRPGLDSAAYLDLARRVAGGDLLLGDRVYFLSPFYIYFVAAGLALSGGSVLAVQIAQAALGTAAVWLVAETARPWLGARGARAAAALAAATGYFAFQESLLLQSAVDPFLTALGLWALARAWVQPRPRRFLLAGAALGLHVLNRPNVALWAAAAVALTAAGAFGRHRAQAGEARAAGVPSSGAGVFLRRPAVTRAGALAAGLVLALAPVALRNLAVAGDLVLVSSHGGLNFYIGNNPRADGTYRPVEGITPSIEGQARDMRALAERETGRPQTDAGASSWFLGRALAWIGQNPAAAASLFAAKMAYVFNAADIPLNDSYAYYATDETSALRLLVVGPWLLLPLGLAGAWLGRPRAHVALATPGRDTDGGGASLSPWWWAFVAFVPVYAVGVAAFFVTGRYRLPILVALCVTAAGSLLSFGDWLRARRWRDLALAGGVLAVLAAATNVNLGLDNGLAAWRTEMVLLQIAGGQDAEADALLARTEPMHPNPGLLLARAGRAWLARGDAAKAARVLERADALAPGRREIGLDLGKALLALGRAPEAAARLRAAQGVEGREGEARLALAQAEALAGETGAALRELARVGQPEALDASAQVEAGRLALGLGRADLAEPYLGRAVREAPDRPEVREAYGLALATLGRRDEATAALEEAARLDPGNAGVRMNLAILYAGAGRFEDARRLAHGVLEAQPGDARARDFLSSLPPGGRQAPK